MSDHRGNYAGAAGSSEVHHGQGAGSNTGLMNHQQHSGLDGERDVSSAVGLMSLDDPNFLSGLPADDNTPSFFPGMNLNMNLGGMPSLSAIPADDPDATPMPLKENPPPSAPPGTLSLPRSASTSGVNTATPRESDLKELREFWKQYMRTPFSGPGPAEGQNSHNSTPQHQHQEQQQQQSFPPPGFRRPRVASMPSSKTPTIALSLQNQTHQHHQQNQQPNDPSRGESGMRTTLHEDLKSYEAAVMARKAPTNLNLVPKMRRGTVPGLTAPGHSPSSPVDGTQGGSPVIAGKGVGVVPMVKFDLLGRPDTRPSSASTSKSGSSGDGSSSLAGAFGAQQQKLQGSPHLSSQAFTLMRRGSPASSTTGDSSSRASSVSVDQEGDTSDDGGAASAASGDSGRVGRLRPAFKRLASTALGPPNAKRAFLAPSSGSAGGMGGGEHSSEMPPPQQQSHHHHGAGNMTVDPATGTGVDEFGQGYAPGAVGMH